ncbi:hypothetical protein ACJ72_01396 [Emergomyces africanus]|uniref:Uncharacterized protein n=1 Tax=Emergomyces africanus TaxID=1955775 RepID=A0A1B7P5D1_9EURO|nr:hypothetical protein ACJ72_01396 [Emergomyces africanus]
MDREPDLVYSHAEIFQDLMSTKVEVIHLNNFMDLLTSLFIELLQDEIDEACVEQHQSKRIKRGRFTSTQNPPVPDLGGPSFLPGSRQTSTALLGAADEGRSCRGGVK